MAYTITRYGDGAEVREDFPGQSIVNVVDRLVKQPGYTFVDRDRGSSPRAVYLVRGPDGQTITVDIDHIA